MTTTLRGKLGKLPKAADIARKLRERGFEIWEVNVSLPAGSDSLTINVSGLDPLPDDDVMQQVVQDDAQ